VSEVDFPWAKRSRGAASWVVAMYKVILENPTYFTTDFDDNTTPLLVGITIENWNRAYKTLR
jgi:hypothetical protein